MECFAYPSMLVCSYSHRLFYAHWANAKMAYLQQQQQQQHRLCQKQDEKCSDSLWKMIAWPYYNAHQLLSRQFMLAVWHQVIKQHKDGWRFASTYDHNTTHVNKLDTLKAGGGALLEKVHGDVWHLSRGLFPYTTAHEWIIAVLGADRFNSSRETDDRHGNKGGS